MEKIYRKNLDMKLDPLTRLIDLPLEIEDFKRTTHQALPGSVNTMKILLPLMTVENAG
jgi:hypothetical protein